jgi:hypothetical protein
MDPATDGASQKNCTSPKFLVQKLAIAAFHCPTVKHKPLTSQGIQPLEWDFRYHRAPVPIDKVKVFKA